MVLQPCDHLAKIEEIVSDRSYRPAAADWKSESWRRCIVDYKLDPSRPDVVELSQREIREESELFGDLSTANAELDRALLLIQESGYSAYLASRNGTILTQRQRRDAQFVCDTDRVGFVWNEKSGGTNGIGTSILTGKATTVYLNEHFFADLTVQACAAAPFFDPDGDLLGIVNLSTRNAAIAESTHRIVFEIARNAARRLEAQAFRDRFPHQYLMQFGKGMTAEMLAVDEDFRVVGATRASRERLSLTESSIGNRSLWAVFEKPRGLASVDGLCDLPASLKNLLTGEAFSCSFNRPTPLVTGRTAAKVVGLPAVGLTKLPRKTADTDAPSLEDCVGGDPGLQKEVQVLRKLMGSGLHLLLLGETGVGKDTLARALHEDSLRRKGPFTAFNCAAIPESLIDSELFGYTSGAFTGASRDGSAGRIVEADGGTLFLDEIGDMPLALQTRLLRFLETSEVMPLGSGKKRTVDVQIIAATNRDLPGQIRDGLFRQDLFHRLAGAVATLPPLRERPDRREIIQSVLYRHAGNARLEFTADAWALLLSHDWPGNIRELRNVVKRAVALAESTSIDVEDLRVGGTFRIGGMSVEAPAAPADPTPGERVSHSVLFEPPGVNPSKVATAKSTIIDAEKVVIRKAIEQASGDALACASLLGVSRATMYRKLKQHGLSLG